LVKASKTRLRGASKTRVIAISRSEGVVTCNVRGFFIGGLLYRFVLPRFFFSSGISIALGLPQSHHPPLRIREEREHAHAGHLLLLYEHFASGLDDTFAIFPEVIDINVKRHVARPGLLVLRLHDAPVDPALPGGFDDVVTHFGNVLNLPVEDLLVELR
jgi:hypothetical protein